jgi:hypothetical protein
MSASVSLTDLRAAYKRTSSRIYRILEDGYDFGFSDLVIEALDRDALIINAAFFVLVFGQMESRINQLAASRVTMETQRQALREQKFARRMGLALPGPGNRAARDKIAVWYDVRNDAAHGERLVEYDIDAIFERADQLEAMIRGEANAGR